MAAPARRPGLGVPDREGGPGAHRDAEDLRPASGGARGAPAGGGAAAGEAALLPDRGRRARSARPPDVGRAAEVPARRREGPEDAGVPAPVRRRRRARPDGGGREEARGRVAADAGGARGRARAPRARGARRPTGAARRDPALRLAAAALVPPRPARDRRDRPRLGERDPLEGEALAVRALDRPLRRRYRAAVGGD